MNRCAAASALLVLMVCPLPSRAARPFTPSDIFRVESFGAVAPSPDERLLAIVRVRPKTTVTMHMRNFMDGRDRSDVWIHDLANAVQHNITNGHTDGSGYFAPAWSPDGERLAVLSTRGNNVTLWEWRRSTRVLRQVSVETVELNPPVWISNSEVVCATPPDGELPRLFDLEVRAATKAIRAWPKSWSGAVVTASALVSGSELREDAPPQGKLLTFNLVSGRVSTVATGTYTAISASPYGRQLAAFEAAERFLPEPGKQLLNRGYFKYRLVVFDGKEKRTAVELEDGQEPLPGAVIWLANGGLVARIASVSERPDWFLIGSDGERTNLTSELKTVPASIIAARDGRGLLWLEQGRLSRLTEDRTNPELLFQQADATLQSIVFHDSHTIVARAQRKGRSVLLVADPGTGSLREISEPAAAARLVTYLATSGTAVFSGATRGGTFLWTTRVENSSPQVLMRLNAFTETIAEGSWRSFEYESSGKKLTGWLLLPPGSQQGQRYRTVVSVYPGLVYSAASGPRESIQSTQPYNLQLLAAHGYAVLFPSIPLTPEEQPGEPYSQIAEAVLPAVDAAIKIGVADPDRLALTGHSFGGYGTFALTTQTTRFKAAIAMAGFANLVSLYGQLDPRARFEDDARDRLIFMMFAESGQFRMAAPPWSDMERYVRNSPISYVDRVETPVMIVQGDQDYVPIQQGEEFFTALFRQNKPAVFVRYWGEGHVLESPANIIDLWNRIYEWLDRYLGRPE